MVAQQAPRAEGAAPRINVASLVHDVARAHPTQRALVDKATGVVRSFRELSSSIEHCARALAHAGLKPGDRAAVLLTGGVDFVTVVNALLHLGAVPVLVDPGMGVSRMLACFAEQQPRALVGVAKAHVLKTASPAAFCTVEVAVLVGAGAVVASLLRARALTTLLESASALSPLPPRAPLDDDEPGAILYTSGSTGAPKGVVYTQAMLAAQARAIAEMFDVQPGDVDVSCFLPFALFSVAMGMTAVFPAMDMRHPAKAKPQRVLEALLEEGATSAFASPALWEPFARHLDDKGVSLPRVKRILTAGAPVRPALHDRFMRHLPRGEVFTPYGATEALPVTFLGSRRIVHETAAKTRAGAGTCVGKPVSCVEVRILRLSDDVIETWSDDLVLPLGEIGEIVVRGDVVTRLYDRRPDATAAAKIRDGARVWHRMGDVGYLDAAGDLWFCGRKAQRVTTTSGELFSVPVEALFENDPRVARAALVGLGARPAQVPVVCIELQPGVPATDALREQLLDDVRAMPGAPRLEHLLFHERFPVDRRHNAKIEREALASWARTKLPQLETRSPA